MGVVYVLQWCGLCATVSRGFRHGGRGRVDAGLALSYWYYEAFSFFALLDTHMAHNWQHVKARARGSTLDKVARMRTQRSADETVKNEFTDEEREEMM